MAKLFWKVVEWLGRAETVHTILQAEFVRTLLLPTVATVLTGTAGVFGGIPLMWVLMATALTFMATTVGMLVGGLYVERKNPLNKLSHQAIFNCDLAPAKPALLGSRQQRRAAGKQHLPDLSPTQLDMHVSRNFVWGQLGLELTNNSTFPISCFLERAETQIEDFEPPRSTFPKEKVIIAPGDKIRLTDDRMAMENWPCQRMSGKLNMTVRYGLLGKEKFTLDVEGTIVIVTEHYGFTSQIQFSPKSTTSTTAPSTT